MDRESEATMGEMLRYRLAAEDALQQLDWCIGYLHGIPQVGDLGATREESHFHQAEPDAGANPAAAFGPNVRDMTAS